MQMTPRIAYLIDPRFSGGTSAAVARELRETAGIAQVSVHAVESRMFSGRNVAGPLVQALDDLGLTLTWDDPVIGADLVIVHNPSFLKRQTDLPARIVARHLIAVTHENFLRPGGIEAFDVRHCLDAICRRALVLRRSLAPISAANRTTVTDWMRARALPGWDVLDRDWINICDDPLCPPTGRPADRRGRHSRPGFEKFPSLDALDACFPPHAEANVILGADTFMADEIDRPHWQMHRFGALGLTEYFEKIDFMVYFTAPGWGESYGRVVAEAVAAGKVVIADEALAMAFPGAVVACRPDEVDAVIAGFIADPARYRAQVLNAQAGLAAHSATAFRAGIGAVLATTARVAA